MLNRIVGHNNPLRFVDPLGLCPKGSVNIYGGSFDIFIIGGFGADAGIYHNRNTGEVGLYGAVEAGFGIDTGASIETGYADNVKEALSGSYLVSEGGVGGASLNISQSKNGDQVTVFNAGTDNGGLPTGHTGVGRGGTIRLWGGEN